MDLVSLPPDLDRKKIESRYRLVEAVSRRARVLYHGAMPKIASKSKKMTTLAFEEVVSGSMRILSGDSAIVAQEKADKQYQDMIDQAKQKESRPEDLTELEKDLHAFLHEKKAMANGENTD